MQGREDTQGRKAETLRRRSKEMRPSMETIADIEGVPIRDYGEPPVDLRAACPGVVVGEQPLFARQGVAARLNAVQTWLDTHYPEYRLRIGDAYRSPAHQARLFRWAMLVAPPEPPSRTWGGVLARWRVPYAKRVQALRLQWLPARAGV